MTRTTQIPDFPVAGISALGGQGDYIFGLSQNLSNISYQFKVFEISAYIYNCFPLSTPNFGFNTFSVHTDIPKIDYLIRLD